jgi:membrane protease subunit (stomatin/prohibitin family)
MPDENPTLSAQKRDMEKKLHEVLLEFEKNTGLAVTSIQIQRIDEGRVLPITSEALKTKVELIT